MSWDFLSPSASEGLGSSVGKTSRRGGRERTKRESVQGVDERVGYAAVWEYNVAGCFAEGSFWVPEIDVGVNYWRRESLLLSQG